ncbi:hypothetical protein K0M31_006585 [Melipona bicolor]|uniref:Uncharacterized protein n=1 Tax=Melipona bicolor TaxID=60889 RepID=A0AA40FRV0_9HYME|nr:hypothetical protein K0M31_006585 [Melipona bicolor]
MSHQLTPDSTRLPSSVGATPSYGLPASVTYPSSLLPSTSSTSTHINHQVSSAAASSTYQQANSHQLSPTPNSLVTMMGPNSANSNSASDQLTSADLPISSVSPVQQQQQQQQQQQASQGNSSPSWNLPISSGGRVGLSGSPTCLQQPHAHPHQAFASHYGAQGFQQPPRPAPQSFYSWY